MSKLFKLRDWFTIKDAASHLSSAMSETVTEADVLRLVMDGHLKIALFLGHDQFAVRNQMLSQEQIEDSSWSDGYRFIERWRGCDGASPSEGIAYLRPENRFYFMLRGVHDFPLFGRQVSLVEREYFRLTGGPDIDRTQAVFLVMNERPSADLPDDGHFVDVDGRPLVRLVDVADPEPRMLGALPEHSFFVIRAGALQRFYQSLVQPADEEQLLSSRSRTNYLGIIGALADLYWKTAYPGQDFKHSKMLEDLVPYKGYPGITESQSHLKDSLTLAMQLINQQ